MIPYEPSELILNPDGSVFHLHLKPGEVADRIILVGDPGRVDMVGGLLQDVEFRRENREFVSLTGSYSGARITVLSTGIGTDNIDIVMNELDALVNIDLNTRLPKKNHTSLRIVRIGTSGALQPDLPTGSWISSGISVGLDGLMNYYPLGKRYAEPELISLLKACEWWPESLPLPYAYRCGHPFETGKTEKLHWGITITAHGFYAPQGRCLRAGVSHPDLNRHLTTFGYNGLMVTNFEMESSALYGLSDLLGHESLTICLIVANRIRKQFLEDYHPAMLELVIYVLDHFTAAPSHERNAS